METNQKLVFSMDFEKKLRSVPAFETAVIEHWMPKQISTIDELMSYHRDTGYSFLTNHVNIRVNYEFIETPFFHFLFPKYLPKKKVKRNYLVVGMSFQSTEEIWIYPQGYKEYTNELYFFLQNEGYKVRILSGGGDSESF